jgi:hypothetical protein
MAAGSRGAPARYVRSEWPTSSSAAVASFEAETKHMSVKMRRAHALRKRADAARVQQLRGIFAACDEDVDGLLSEKYVHRPVQPALCHVFTSFQAVSFSLQLTSPFDDCRELEAALLSLGVEPIPDTLARFSCGGEPGVDQSTFLVTAMAKLDSAPLSDSSILRLFRSFDPDGSGRVPLATLLHVLCEVETPSALSIDEVNELLRMTVRSQFVCCARASA